MEDVGVRKQGRGSRVEGREKTGTPPGTGNIREGVPDPLPKSTMDTAFWKGKKVFITGHTGFKGSWLCIWLDMLGAKVFGYALSPPTVPSLFELARVSQAVQSVIADVRDLLSLQDALALFEPEIVIHMAAQPIVRDSYKRPVETYEVNVMGTIHVLESVRNSTGIRAVINVTTDKCYENREQDWSYREDGPMGGYDPYSNSKACSELVTSAYRSSFFNPKEYDTHGVALASARAGNVIGGGDWAVDRLVPDCIRALLKGEKVRIRNPHAVRPWQYVLEPLSGYLELAQRLCEDGIRYAEAWNFGPPEDDAKPVEWLVQRLCQKWGGNAGYTVDHGEHPHEAQYLKLNCAKAAARLGWQPRWTLEQAIDRVIEWTEVYRKEGDIRAICARQVEEYSGIVNR
jgi:CDP-glucose 4,6-dehydratase